MTTNMTPVETVRQGIDLLTDAALVEDGIFLVAYVTRFQASHLVRLVERAGGVAIVGDYHANKGTRVDFTISIDDDEYLLNTGATMTHSLDRGVERYSTIYLLRAKSAGWATYQYLGPAARGGIRIRRLQASGKINRTVEIGDAVCFTTFSTY